MKNNITKDDLDKVISYLKTKDPILTSSSKVLEFEKKWSKWLKVKYSVFVNSGSSANLLSMALLKIRHPNGGEVIVSPLNWASDITSIIQNGFKPIFVDINLETLSMDNNKIIVVDHQSGEILNAIPLLWPVKNIEINSNYFIV